jgi:hypothetical protein
VVFRLGSLQELRSRPGPFTAISKLCDRPLTSNLSLGVEYRYSRFGTQTFNLGSVAYPAGAASAVTARLDERTSEITARLNIKYGGLFGLGDPIIGDTLASWWGGLDAHAPPPAPRSEPAPRVYGGADYLLWWVKGAPLPVPLVTTGTVPRDPGTIGFADTVILYGAPFAPNPGGNDTQSFPGFNGSRVTLGYWLDEAQRYAVEGRGFLLQTRSAGYEARSDANGSPNINVPFANTITFSPIGAPNLIEGPGEIGFPASQVGILTGGISISNSLRFWGLDATGVMTLYRAPSWEVSALGGFRYLDLSETFNLALDLAGVSPGFFAGQNGSLFDVFQTRNQFYGASLGLRGRYVYGPLSLETSGRVSLGLNHEVLNVYGGYQAYNFVAPGAVSTGPEGIFAMPANSGRFTSNDFAVVPEVQVKLGYDVTPAIRLSVGYDVLYESSVVRPGDQINRYLPKGQIFLQNGGAVSTTSPATLFDRTDFFAHGLTAGVSFRF